MFSRQHAAKYGDVNDAYEARQQKMYNPKIGLFSVCGFGVSFKVISKLIEL